MDISLLFPIIILLLFIPLFLNGRKQRRQVQEARQLQHDLTDGDVVITTSGMRATVVDSSYEETVDLEIAPGVVTTWLRVAVQRKVDPAAEAGAVSQTDEHEEPIGTLESGTETRSGPGVEVPGNDVAGSEDGATASNPTEKRGGF